VTLLPATAPAADEVQFTAAEIQAILAHGPWPAAATRDPSNRVSGKREAVELGQRLFFDTRIVRLGGWGATARAATADRTSPTASSATTGSPPMPDASRA